MKQSEMNALKQKEIEKMNREAVEKLKYMFVEEHSISNITISHPSEENLLNVREFKKNFDLEILEMNDLMIRFEVVNVDASFVNALRRVLLAEVPSMAFDKIMMFNNTSVVPDEVLAHRLALCPIKVDPRLFEYKTDRSEEAPATEEDTLIFKLHVKCKKGEKQRREVTTADLTWFPIGNQAALFAGNEPHPVNFSSPIVLTKLLPGQEVELEAHCLKGTGGEHAKFQPVATAYYKPLPRIILKRQVKGEAAHRLRTCFSPGVIAIDEINGEEVARVADCRLDTVSRNVFRFDDLKDAVELSLHKDHFIFTVESTGIIPPQTLVSEAVKILIAKAQTIRQELEKGDDKKKS